MRLSPLLAAVPSELSPQTFPADIAPNDTVIRGIGYDSRTVAPGDLFVALRGADQDGHDYLAEALRAGASAPLVEDRARLPAGLGVPPPVVGGRRRALHSQHQGQRAGAGQRQHRGKHLDTLD